MPGVKRAEDAVTLTDGLGAESDVTDLLQVQGTKVKLEDRTGRDTNFFCVVSTAPAEKQW